MKRSARRSARPATLWGSAGGQLDELMLAYTVGDDREWDRRLLAWDVIGSLGHIEGLRASRLLSVRDHARLKAGLRAAFRAVAAGRLVIGPEHEDAHSAVELWLTRRTGAAGERLHTGRSRNDQIACDLRLYMKESLLALQTDALGVVGGLLMLADRYQDTLWPGYTHTRRAMPSSAGAWAAAFAEGILDTVEALPALWARVDRSPLGSAAGYGVPLPLNREAAARALGFVGIDHNVAGVQNGRGKLEADVLFWCVQLGHELAKMSSDVILYSGEEFGLLRLPERLATGSSIMPHKRNPDLFELTRARAASVEGDLATVLAIRGKLTSGYHRDFQHLKAPLIRGLTTTDGMLMMLAIAMPQLEVDRARAREALSGGVLATDEVMRRVDLGIPFRRAYREVKAALRQGAVFPVPAPRAVLSRRRSTGGLGRLGLGRAWRRFDRAQQWSAAEIARFHRALNRLVGRQAR